MESPDARICDEGPVLALETGRGTRGPVQLVLRAAVVRVFDHPVVARCQLHKLRNVADKLPDHLASTRTKRMRAPYRAQSAILAEAQLEALAKELERTRPGAAASLRECLSEKLTVLRLGVLPTLARTLRSTNSIESMISIARNHSMNVKDERRRHAYTPDEVRDRLHAHLAEAAGAADDGVPG
ncbi:transposase, mutator family [mine drainage metagenome]|uniref:Transposase, mutator family n=1 Tax=mine drainage metagenome TaxID=410659 RepID=A0A1J5QF01_9ZZZZ